MASRTLHLAAVALGCILMSFNSFALPLPPWAQESEENKNVEPTTPPTVATTHDTSFSRFSEIHLTTNSNNENTVLVGGFHLKLSEDISIAAASGSTLDYFSVHPGDDEELFLEEESGFNNIKGVFSPSNGLYHLSTLVHLSAAVPQDQDPAAAAVTTPAVEDSEKPPRVTVTFCINNNCGSSSILKSSSSLPSSGDLQTVSVSGILQLKQGQKVTVRVHNHSTNRQVVVSEQSSMSAYLLKAL